MLIKIISCRTFFVYITSNSWMKKLKFGIFFIINRTLSNFPPHWKKFSCQKVSKKKRKTNCTYTHNFLFQEFVNVPLNWFNIKLVTINEMCHQIQSSELRFPNKVVLLLSKLYYYSTKTSSISTKIEK